MEEIQLFLHQMKEVDAVDYSIVAIQILDKITKEKRLPIPPRIFDVRRALPFPDSYFDAVYSHMLLNMRFSLDKLHFLFSDIMRVLKRKGFNFFSVRNHNGTDCTHIIDGLHFLCIY
jgi:SAM-dependent methyltransferase